MPLCPRCSTPLACTCATRSPKKLGAVSEECPLTKPGAIWVHVVDDRGIDVDGVGTTNGDDGKPTDRSGTAVFDSVPKGDYAVDLETLSTDLLDRFEKPASPTRRTVSVAPGQIAYVPYQLSRKPSLSVKVALKGTSKKVFGGATVSVKGPGDPTGPTTDGSGLTDFGRVATGRYTVSVALDDADEEKYATTLDFESTEVTATLAPGEERVVVVDVEAINVITSKVKVDPAELIIDHGPESYESEVACVELSLQQTNTAHRYDKQATFKCASDTDVEAFWDEACSGGQRLDGSPSAGIVLPSERQDELRDGKIVKVYLRGKSTAGPLAISLELEAPDDRFVKLGEASAPVEAKIQLLARPHVNIEWLNGGGVDDVKVKLAGDGGNHAIPDSIGGGFAKWASRGITPGLYNCALSFPGDVAYLLFDAGGTPVDNPSLDLKPGAPSVTFKIHKVKATLAVACETAGVAEDVAAKVKVKSVGSVVTLAKKGGPTVVEIPVTVLDQKCEIESVTIDGDGVYEMVMVETT